MKTKNKLIILLLTLVALLPFVLGLASLQNKTISAWLAYWDAKNGVENLKNNFADEINEINLFFYALDKNGNIVNISQKQEDYKQTIDNLGKIGVRIVPSITNDIIYSKTEKKLKDPEIINQILNNNDLRQKHLQQIINIIDEVKADGIDIDYENIYIKDTDIFIQFIKELSVLVHSKNKTLNVTVQQKTENHKRSSAGVMDWRKISQYADKITIMCYNYSSKISGPGPICPLFWLKDIISFAKSQIPSEKICIALALHGYDWSKEKVVALNFKTAIELIDTHSSQLRWDKKNQTPFFIYYENGLKHQVWFENEESITKKLKIIKKYKIQHIALWHLSILDTSLSETLKSFLK